MGQAYIFAIFGNMLASGSLKTTDNPGPHAPFRRHNYLWFVPLIVLAATAEDDHTYRWPDPHAILLPFALVAFFFGFVRVFKDSATRRFGASTARDRGALIYASVASVAAAIVVFVLQFEGST